MTYDFDTIIDRSNTNSVKWDFVYDHGKMTPRPHSENILDKDNLLALWVADMDFSAPPTVVDALVKRAQHGVFGYAMPTDSYFDAIIGWMQRRHDWTVEKDWILTAPGVVPSLNFLVQTFTDPGKQVMITTPVYHPFYFCIENNDRVIVRNPLLYDGNCYAIDWDDLEANLADENTQMYINCSPHNPVGRVFSAEELQRIAALCKQYDVLLISDEIHHDLIYKGANFTTLGVAAPEALDHSIVLTAPSKTFNVPGLKTSNIFVKNETLREKLQNTLMRHGLYGVTAFGILALQTAYETGDDWLDAALEYIEGNCNFLCAYLAKHLPKAKLIQPQGTYLAWVDFNGYGLKGDDLYAKMLNEAKVYFNNGNDFGEAGDGFLRINLSCSRRLLAEALNRIATTLNN